MKKKKDTGKPATGLNIDTELMRMYMMGAANPANTDKKTPAVNTIDLHVDQSKVGKGKIPENDVLLHQLQDFEKALDNAIAAGKFEIRVVHGIGKGKLKAALYKLLAKHPQVKSYQNDYHSRYGFGSTIIHFY